MTEAVRREIQRRRESLRTLTLHYGVNLKTVAKWKKREPTANHRTDRTVSKSTFLSVEQEAIIVAFRKHTLLGLDDYLCRLAVHDPAIQPLS